MADRIVLMGHADGQGTATLVRSWQVDLPRPRDPHAPDTAALRLDILSALQHLRLPTQRPLAA